MSEFHRILKENGSGIFLVHIYDIEKTYEDN